MGFIKYNKQIIYISSLILGFYAVFFYMRGYSLALWAFLPWAVSCIVANLFASKNAFISFGALTVVSYTCYYTVRSYIPIMFDFPHYQIHLTILTIIVGCMIDGLYWVYKYKSGKKFKTSYED